MSRRLITDTTDITAIIFFYSSFSSIREYRGSDDTSRLAAVVLKQWCVFYFLLAPSRLPETIGTRELVLDYREWRRQFPRHRTIDIDKSSFLSREKFYKSFKAPGTSPEKSCLMMSEVRNRIARNFAIYVRIKIYTHKMTLIID